MKNDLLLINHCLSKKDRPHRRLTRTCRGGTAILTIVLCGWALCLCADETVSPEPRAADAAIYRPENLVAWCIVPFDAKHRTPVERAEMLERLGIRKVAYDWRDEHVASFEAEILAYRSHGLEYFAFWDEHPAAFALFKQYGLRPQIWKIIPTPADAANATDEARRVAAAGTALLPLVDTTRQLGCRVGLYNHGGWAGEPATMVAVCRWLREHAAAEHVGIVYNFHHGHEHMSDFRAAIEMMLPYLLCVNINGMNDGAEPKILGVGKGQHELAMLQTLIDVGYQGPIGIIDHRETLDAELSLRENLDGLESLRPRLHGR